MYQNKQLYSLEAERSVIGSILISPEVISSVSEIVIADDFFRPEHCSIFSAFVALADSGEALDILTAGEWLDKNNQLEEVGGIAYLFEVAENTPSAANAISYAEIVKEHSARRKIATAANEIMIHAYDRDGMTSSDMVQNAERLIMQLGDTSKSKGEFRAASDILIGTVDRIDELYNSDSAITGLSTGLVDLDEMTMGLQKSDLIILAARPSMGKTSLAMNIGEHVAINEKKVVAVFSIEMPSEQLMTRMLSSVGRIDQTRMRSGKLIEEDWSKLMIASKRIKDSKLLINDTSSMSPSEMRAKLKKVRLEHGSVGLIIIDYLQLMKIPNFKEGRVNEISEISRSLKSIAKEFECPVIALSQLNRSLENRPNKRPINSDLRESGAIEQDADVIMFIYRDEVYHEDSPHKGIAEIIIGKQRNGPIGTCRAAFLGQYSRFENLSATAYSETYSY